MGFSGGGGVKGKFFLKNKYYNVLLVMKFGWVRGWGCVWDFRACDIEKKNCFCDRKCNRVPLCFVFIWLLSYPHCRIDELNTSVCPGRQYCSV